MNVSYDPIANAAYIRLGDTSRKFARMVALDPSDVGGMINLDFDEDGFVLGIEFIDATGLLSPEVLSAARFLDGTGGVASGP